MTRPWFSKASLSLQASNQILYVFLWRITIDSIVTALGCSHSLAYSIMHDCLKFQEEFTGCVPIELKDREKMNRMGFSLQHLLRYADEGEDMLNRIFLRMNHWLHYYQPKLQVVPMQ
jgi:hypothetical protein